MRTPILPVLALAAGLWLGLSASLAMAGDDICRFDHRGGASAGMGDCPYNGGNGTSNTAVTTAYGGVRLNAATYAMTPIHVHGICRYVDNNSGSVDTFVPFKSSEEWSAFLSNYPRDLISYTTCACPFGGGQDDSKNLRVGPTMLNTGMGDNGPQYGGVNAIGYGRTGVTYNDPSTYSLTDNCYEEYAQYKCWNWVQQTCSGCASMSLFGCTSYYSYDCSYCADEGSTCEKRWYSWTETFGFNANAGNCDSSSPSWNGNNWRISGERPGQCNTRCTFTGHDCVGCNSVPTTARTCSVPGSASWDSWTYYFCTLPGSTAVCINFVLQYLSYENQVASLAASGDLCGAASVRNSQNSWVSSVNSSCQTAAMAFTFVMGW